MSIFAASESSHICHEPKEMISVDKWIFFLISNYIYFYVNYQFFRYQRYIA